MKKSTRENLIQQIKNFGKPIFPKTVEQAIFDINDGTSLTDKLEDLQDQIDNIDGGGGGDGGPASWGNITGDIESQEDLQDELDLKANVSDIPETYLEDVAAGTNVTIDKTDPYNPVINSSQEEVDPTVPSWAKQANKPSYTKAEVGLGNVDNTSDLLKPISNAVQTALEGKVDNSRVLTDVPANAEFTDTVYTHPPGTNPHGTTKADVGLGNVDNTSDVNKPISTLTQSALNNKLDDPDGSDDEVIAGDGSLIGTFQLQAGAGISITESNGIVTISLQQQ